MPSAAGRGGVHDDELPGSLLYEDWLRRGRAVDAAIDRTGDADVAALRRLAGEGLLVRAGLRGTVLVTQADPHGHFAAQLDRWVETHAAGPAQQRALRAWLPEDETLRRLRPGPGPPGAATAINADVDAFLEAYPHCLAKESDVVRSDSSDDEPEDDRARGIAVRSAAPALVPAPTPAAQNPYTSVKLPMVAPRLASVNHVATQNFYPTMDFVQEPPLRQQQQPTMPRPPSAQGPSYSSHRPVAPDPQTHAVTNPFQTAAEYARSDPTQVQRPQPLPEHEQQHQLPAPVRRQTQHSANFIPTFNNPYENGINSLPHTINNGVASPPPPPPPVIRESLKRKYQPPIRKVIPTGNCGQHPVQAAAQVPSLADKGTAVAVSEEEEELPEPLQRFGKELVNKIRDEILDTSETITFDDIAGLVDAKQTVQEVVCWPMKRPDLFTGLRRAPNGLLLFGPPGTGKTLIAKAIAHESGATFFSISSSSLTSKWIGEGEKLVRVLFAVAAYHEPSVVFVDEIDSLLTQRKSDENEASRRIKTEFLVQLDGTGTDGQGRVLMIGATNRPQELDEAARRRFTKRLYIPLPEEQDRQALLRVLLTKNKHELTDEEIRLLAKDTAGFSGADLKALCTDAAMGPIRALGARALEVDCNEVPPISYKHFRRSLRSMNPSVAPSDLEQYVTWDELYGNKRAGPADDTEE